MTRQQLNVLVGDREIHFAVSYPDVAMGACAVFNLDSLVAHRNLTTDLVPGQCPHVEFHDQGAYVADDAWRERFYRGWPLGGAS